MMFRRALPCVLLASACLGIPLRAAVRWDFNGTGSPSGAKLELRSGTPTFTTTGEEEGLAAGTRLEWADTPELRLRPELEILCRFRLDELVAFAGE